MRKSSPKRIEERNKVQTIAPGATAPLFDDDRFENVYNP